MIRKKVDYYHFYIDSSVETNGLENVIKILKKKKNEVLWKAQKFS